MATSNLRVQESSLQFSDSPKQQKHDVLQLFKSGIAYPIKSGTEAGKDNANHDALVKCADEFNHALHFVGSNWIAVDRAIIKPGTLKKGKVFVADTSKVAGPGHDSQMATVSFTHTLEGVGEINYGSVHYPTKGQKPGDPNYHINKLYAQKIEEWMKNSAQGNDLAFIAGDFNMHDRDKDWSFGRDFLSMADELKAWQSTGHGSIDGFASYNKDTRVKAKKFTVLDDTELKMYSDHFVCRGVWTINHLNKKGKS